MTEHCAKRLQTVTFQDLFEKQGYKLSPNPMGCRLGCAALKMCSCASVEGPRKFSDGLQEPVEP